MKNRKGLSGFTLIELLIVIGIVGILAAITIPMYKMLVLKTRLASTVDALSSLSSAEAYPMQTAYTDVAGDFRVVNNEIVNAIALLSYDQGKFPNKEVLVTSLRLRKSMEKNNDKVIYFYWKGPEVIPIIKKADEKYELVIDNKEVKNFLVYKDLFGKK